jgi:hypothetical protein
MRFPSNVSRSWSNRLAAAASRRLAPKPWGGGDSFSIQKELQAIVLTKVKIGRCFLARLQPLATASHSSHQSRQPFSRLRSFKSAQRHASHRSGGGS